MTPEQIITAVALLLSTDANSAFDTLRAGGYDPHYPVEIIACPETTSSLDVEGHSLICGTVSVPEDYSMPENPAQCPRGYLSKCRPRIEPLFKMWARHDGEIHN